jgi:hypothetical protein
MISRQKQANDVESMPFDGGSPVDDDYCERPLAVQERRRYNHFREEEQDEKAAMKVHETFPWKK